MSRHDNDPRPHTPQAQAEAQDQPRQRKTAPRTQRQQARAKTQAQKQARARNQAATAAATTAAATPPYDNSLPIIQRHAAGIDIGSRSHWVCVGPTVAAREFPAHTDGLQQIVAWLRTSEVTTVAVESTGIYWVALYELLEHEGFEVLLVDPGYTKQVKGRPKTDRLDCQWIQRLHAHGLLPAAFRPDEPTCVLRSYLRQRANHVRYASQHIQHMQKALEQMNLKLTEVVNDITGQTGLTIIKAIVRGEHDPETLARYRNVHCKRSGPEIAQALHGSYRAEHLFALEQALAGWEFYQQQIRAVEDKIADQLRILKKQAELPPLPPKTRIRRKHNEPHFDVRQALYYVTGIDLTELEGVNELTALTVLSEIGTDMGRWPTVKHFCSWLGLCPRFKKTGGKVKSSHTRPGRNRAAAALCLAASSLHRSKGALGAYLRAMKSRLGAPKAVTATAHKLARLIYYALRHGMTYVRQSQEEYEAKLRERQIASVKRKARHLGLEVTEPAAATPAGGEPETNQQ